MASVLFPATPRMCLGISSICAPAPAYSSERPGLLTSSTIDHFPFDLCHLLYLSLLHFHGVDLRGANIHPKRFFDRYNYIQRGLEGVVMRNCRILVIAMQEDPLTVTFGRTQATCFAVDS